LLIPPTQELPTNAAADTHFRENVAPTSAGFEHPKNAFEHHAIIFARTSTFATFEFRKQWFDILPLLVSK
jgi:hypothetical protein